MQLILLREIIITTHQPAVLLWSAAEKRVFMIELTIPWEEGMTTDNKKCFKYTGLAFFT